jgi:hypothetical protein
MAGVVPGFEAAADPCDGSLIHQIIRKRTGITRRSMICGRWLPIPWQEIVEPVHFVAVDHALEHVSEVGERFDVIELCRGDEGTDSGPSLCATVGAGKEMIFAPERHGSDSALDGVGIEFDAAVVEKAAKRRPAHETIADCLGQSPLGRHAAELSLKPGFHGIGEGQ